MELSPTVALMIVAHARSVLYPGAHRGTAVFGWVDKWVGESLAAVASPSPRYQACHRGSRVRPGWRELQSGAIKTD